MEEFEVEGDLKGRSLPQPPAKSGQALQSRGAKRGSRKNVNKPFCDGIHGKLVIFGALTISHGLTTSIHLVYFLQSVLYSTSLFSLFRRGLGEASLIVLALSSPAHMNAAPPPLESLFRHCGRVGGRLLLFSQFPFVIFL